MKQVIVSVRDSAVNAFMRPMFVPSVGAAIRSFQDEVNRKAEDNVMNVHPEHFEMFQLGYFDEESGGFEVFTPRSIATALSLYIQKE